MKIGPVGAELFHADGQTDMTKLILRTLSWFGHVQRMPGTRTVKKIFKWKPLTERSQGRPKYRWEDSIKQDISQMKIRNWVACVQDRGKWKEVVEKAKTSHH